MTAVIDDRTTSAGLRLFSSVDRDFVASYQENGFALLANALSPEEVAEVNAEAIRLCRGDLGAITDTPFDDDESDEAVLRRYLCI
ncbi:MAG: hypothetical protein ACRYG2_06820, partial [Janthinobacterium lividum]